MTDRQVYQLGNDVIAQIVRIIQIGILSGTDITDHMRQVIVEPDVNNPEKLKLTSEYLDVDAKNIESMFNHLDELMSQ